MGQGLPSRRRAPQQQTLGVWPIKPRKLGGLWPSFLCSWVLLHHSVLRRHATSTAGPSSQARITWCRGQALLWEREGRKRHRNSPGRGGVGVTLPGRWREKSLHIGVHAAHWTSIGWQATYLPSALHTICQLPGHPPVLPASRRMHRAQGLCVEHSPLSSLELEIVGFAQLCQAPACVCPKVCGVMRGGVPSEKLSPVIAHGRGRRDRTPSIRMSQGSGGGEGDPQSPPPASALPELPWVPSTPPSPAVSS